tara:strand:+ start:143 stop:1270 length:1128 start_codon:yes stop_codon:yes gene_type:complete
MADEDARLLAAKATPEDFYTSNTLVWLLCGGNAIGAVAHGVGVVLTLALTWCTQYELPMFTIATNATVAGDPPRYLGDGVNVTRFKPVLEECCPLDPRATIVGFFALSCAFHVFFALVLLCGRPRGAARVAPAAADGDAAAPPTAATTSAALATIPRSFAEHVTRWYLQCLADCRAPWRWLEYAFSASLLISLAVRLLGTGHVELLWTLTQLMATTIFFGYLTEVYSVQFIATAATPRPFFGTSWILTRAWKPDTVVTRMQIHILGYVPYISCWAILLNQYETTRARLQDDFPEFLPQAIWGSFVAFTLFGLVQLFSQLSCGALRYGPSLYWLGELTYILLSFAAKANMGFVVLAEVLLSDRFDALLYLKRTDAC